MLKKLLALFKSNKERLRGDHSKSNKEIPRDDYANPRTVQGRVSFDTKDLYEEELIIAVLDSRTPLYCGSLDGQSYPVGQGPMPPHHENCRCIRVANLYGTGPIGSRPANPTTEKILLREYAKANEMDAPATRADLPRGHKGKFDAFTRKRKRELIGQVPAKTTYQDWLKRQKVAFQEEVLGGVRAKLFRKGGLTLDRFVDQRGVEYTLAELARRDGAAFRAAGLEPESYLDGPVQESRGPTALPEEA